MTKAILLNKTFNWGLVRSFRGSSWRETDRLDPRLGGWEEEEAGGTETEAGPGVGT